MFPIYIPPLRARKGDLRELTDLFLEAACRENGVELKTLSESAYRKIMEYSWPGNVRELENVIMRAVAMCEAPMIYEDYLALDDFEPSLNDEPDEPAAMTDGDLKHTLEETEKKLLLRAIECNGGKNAEAIKMLGISKTAFYEKIKKYNL